MKLALLLLFTACAFPATVLVRGPLTKVERVWAYEPPCGPFSHKLSEACGDSMRLAYRATVDADSAVPGEARSWRFYFFAPQGNAIPQAGWDAVWVLHRHEIVNFYRCSLYGCQTDLDYQLQSDQDVRPRGDWRKLVDSVLTHS